VQRQVFVLEGGEPLRPIIEAFSSAGKRSDQYQK